MCSRARSVWRLSSPLATVSWAFAAGGWQNLPTTPLGTLTGRSVTWRLIGNHEATFTIDGRRAETVDINELISDVWVTRNGVTLLRSRVGASSDTVDADQHTVTFNAVDYRGVLSRQMLYDSDTLTYTNMTDAAIVTSMINAVQARTNSDLDIVVRTYGTPNLLASTIFAAGQYVGDAITTLSQGSPGFDWDIGPATNTTTLTLSLWFPSRGVDRQRVLSYPGRIASFARTADPGTFANTVRASGGTPTGGTAPASVIVSAAGIASDPAGRWDTQEGDNNLLTTTTLTGFANRMLSIRQYVAPAWTITLNPNDWGGPGDIWLGDPVTIAVQSGRLNVVQSLRVFEVALALDDNSDTATVTLTLGAVHPNKRWLLRAVNRRLATLERR